MSQTNKQRLDTMLSLVAEALGPYVEAKLEAHYGKSWRQYAAFPEGVGSGGELDVQAYLRLFQNEWREVFSKLLDRTARDAATAVNAGRNAWAHAKAGKDVENDITLRALSAGAELLEAIGAGKAQSARALYQALIEQLANAAASKARDKPTAEASTAASPRTTLTLTPKSPPREVAIQLGLGLDGGQAVGALDPWRIVAPPREDITTGQLTLDHFAANLAVVDRREVSGPYGDADEFFRSTHMTHGLKLVLEGGARRLMGAGGPSVIGLQTNFGGGKTHTMLALMHLVRAEKPSQLHGLRDIVGDSSDGLRGAKAVAFSGSDKGPDVALAMSGQRPIRTIWGYLAWRIAGDEGVRLISGAEEAGTNPGAEAFEKVLRAAGGPTLILLDEIVAYVKQLEGARYEANLAFFQSLTEAAVRVPNALVVGSLPESDDEVGGERGKETLDRLERLFGRMQSPWSAAQGAETYAIVRRRLFQELDEAGVAAREKTIAEYRKLYRDHRSDFPSIVNEPTYADLMREAYPVHPMLFDKLAQEWGALERFQRTRGVLKFIAEAARRIWLNQSQDPMIQLGSLPLGDPLVRGSVIEPLEGAVWTAIIDGEVESDRSIPVSLDSAKQRFGERRIATRAARAIFLGTAPRGEAGGGMTRSELNLACATPGENISVFGDAVTELANQSAHLRGKDGAYWFGSDATLRRLADLRARERTDAEADDEIITVLKGEEKKGKGRFDRVHPCLRNPEEAEEATAVALVVLHPEYAHDPKAEASPAMVAATDALKRRGGGRQRLNRNMLIFVAADAGTLSETRKAAKLLLAWRSIVADTHALNLRANDQEEAAREVTNATVALETAVRRAWSHVIVPAPPREDGEPFSLDRVPLKNGAGKSVPEAVWQSVAKSSQVITELGPQTLADRIRDAWPPLAKHVALATVRDWFFQYVRFDRVQGIAVLEEAFSKLIGMPLEDFVYADGVDADGVYSGIVRDKQPAHLDLSRGYIVLRSEVPEVAPSPPPQSVEPPPTTLSPGTSPPPSGPASPAASRPKRFYGSVDLDPQRPVRDIQQIFDGVISEIAKTPGARITLRLEIEASAAGGFSREDASIVRDNAKSLKFRSDATDFADE